MTAAQARTVSVAVGCLCIAYGVIYTLTPGGFSWTLVLLGAVLTVPWLLYRPARDRSSDRPRARGSVPSWHPEFDE